ncbi:MAG TPA: hypothetical protein VMU24_05335, partial [Candidatus Acidoferrales bacterium]|nr:hypothetical protein [Candidatus Acidoferrales bacterium]
MSRIFDALRQSEKDKLAGSERWSLPDPPEPVAAANAEAVAAEHRSEQAPSEVAAAAQPIEVLGENMPQDTIEQIRHAVTPEDITSHIAELARSLQSVKNAARTPSPEHATAYPTFSVSAPAAPAQPELDFSGLKVIDPLRISSPLVVALNNER